MRKLVLAFAMVLAVSGCGDSTQDVTVTENDPSSVPDTVLTKDGLVMEFYLSDHRTAIEKERSVLGREGVQQALERFVAVGYQRDDQAAMFVHTVDELGRSLEVTWFAFVDPTDDDAITGIIHAEVDGQEFIVPLHVPGDPMSSTDPAREVLMKGADGEWGPNLNIRTLFNNCASFVVGVYQACVGQCALSGVPVHACQIACGIAVATAYIACIFFSIFG
jgi:hypothetical protein